MSEIIKKPELVTATTVEKLPNLGYTQYGKNITTMRIKSRITDCIGQNVYVFDEHNDLNILESLNRYCIIDSPKQPFSKLTNEEEAILNPPIQEEPMEQL